MSDDAVVSVRPPYLWAFTVLGLLLFAGWLSLYMIDPPRPLPADAPATEFSAYRANLHNYEIATEPHPAGSPANEKVQEYIRDAMRAVGVDTEIVSELVNGRRGVGQRNMVLGRIPGTSNTKAFAMMAHYDSVPYGPGAADDLGGVVAMIEIARALKASPPLMNDIVFVFTDGEESGKLGAYLFADHPWFDEVAVMANFEARGTRGNALLFGTSEGNGWLIKQMMRAARYPTATSLMYDIYKRMPFSSDFDELRPLGMNGFDIAFVDNFPFYHTKNDTPENLDLGSLQQHGYYGLDMARHFGNIPLDIEIPAPDAMYFNTLGYHMVRYPLSLGFPLALLTALLVIGTLVFGRMRGHISIWGVLAGISAWPLMVALSAATALLMLTAIWGQDTVRTLYTESITRIPNLLPLHHNNLYVASFAAATVAIAALVYGLLCRWVAAQSLAMGAYLWWTALLLGIAWYLPGGGYLLMWPLAFSMAGMLLYFWRAQPGRMSTAWIFLLLLFAVPGIILLTPTYKATGYTIMIIFAPGLAAYAALGMGLLIPQFDLMGRANWWWLPGLSGAAAALMLIIGITNSDYNTLRPKLNSVSYGIDYDTHSAFWLSPDTETDEWTSQFFPPGTPRESFNEFVPGNRGQVLKAAAPIDPAYPGPQLDVVRESTEDGVRELTFHIASPAGAARLDLRLVSDTEILEASVFGKPLQQRSRGRGYWGLNFNLFPREGAEVTLRVPEGSTVRLNARETFYGLPQLPGFRPRPAYMAPTPNTVMHGARPIESNHIYVTRTVDL
jgi:hypothetical protein